MLQTAKLQDRSRPGEVLKRFLASSNNFKLWILLIAFFLVIFFLPFLVSLLQIQSTESKVDTSQALLDVKEGRVEEIMIQDEKLILNYKDGSTKLATKESGESFADLLDKSGVNPTDVKYTVVDQSLTRVIGEVA